MHIESDTQARVGRVLIGSLIVAAGVVLFGGLSTLSLHAFAQSDSSTATSLPSTYQNDDPNVVAAGLSEAVFSLDNRPNQLVARLVTSLRASHTGLVLGCSPLAMA